MKNTNYNQRNNKPVTYQIKVQGRLDESWSDWLDGMVISFDRNSDGSDATVLSGKFVDQAALHGVLNRIRDLHVQLLSVKLTSPETEFQENRE